MSVLTIIIVIAVIVLFLKVFSSVVKLGIIIGLLVIGFQHFSKPGSFDEAKAFVNSKLKAVSTWVDKTAADAKKELPSKVSEKRISR